jgi:hypothetical protein
MQDWKDVLESCVMNELSVIDKKEFEIHSIEDEIRVDGLCRELLQRFYRHLLDSNVLQGEATAHASSADYFIRDFVVSIKQMNILEEKPGIVRQFAGNWYITNTMEPNMRELAGHLCGLKAFYGFLHSGGLISDAFLHSVERECDDCSYYGERIESFWKIQGDGYLEWERECTLKDD